METYGVSDGVVEAVMAPTTLLELEKTTMLLDALGVMTSVMVMVVGPVMVIGEATAELVLAKEIGDTTALGVDDAVEVIVK